MKDAGTLHLGCGENTCSAWHNVDKINHDGVDEVVDLSKHPWPWEDGAFSEIIAEHIIEHLDDQEMALRECSRVLKPGGIARIAVPMGQNYRTDPDHNLNIAWEWDTPEMFCGKRPWDVDVGLEVLGKSTSLAVHVPGLVGGVYRRAVSEFEKIHGPGRWQFDLPATSGEFTIIFHNP